MSFWIIWMQFFWFFYYIYVIPDVDIKRTLKWALPFLYIYIYIFFFWKIEKTNQFFFRKKKTRKMKILRGGTHLFLKHRYTNKWNRACNTQPRTLYALLPTKDKKSATVGTDKAQNHHPRTHLCHNQ
jgi:hypothetical protein